MLGEAVLLSKIDHPNIVRVFDANTITIEDQVFGYFTMEHVAGGSLDRFWRSFGAQFVPVPIAVDLVKQVCRGLAASHSQDPPIIHRDIKPQNILVGYQADGLRAKVSDFGLAKKVNPLTLMATSRGTRQFKAPEALHDVNSDSLAGDVWAIGMTLYLLLTDKLPFEVPDDYIQVNNSKAFQEPLVPPSQVNPICDFSPHISCAVKGAGQQWVRVPPGNWIAPPGSNRSSGGSNEAAEASDVEGREGDLASMQAVM
jgi:serine/threonine-protein kinase